MAQARIMFNMTVKDIVDGLKETQTVVIPIGMIEQHGYHLPVSTDVHNSMEVALRASEVTGCFVTPSVYYNFAGGMLPGTINISPQVFSLMLMDILQSLALQGFKNLILLLGHGGNESYTAAKEAAVFVQWLRPEMQGASVYLTAFWDFSATYQEGAEIGDWHAGLMETSMMLHWKPELVKMEQGAYDDEELCSAMRATPYAFVQRIKRTDSKFIVPQTVQDPRLNVGVMGDFTDANAELGRKIAEECVAGLSAFIRELRTE